uniref:Reverse transcriptase domain-containing protein n=1 Tax=Tanacetum cinerariifolium TaxID=118510 RepID=A0A699GM88_TANCI|nr:reverse transcriptase domain-containing protein [Tanacetum cinerariifolium]
MSAMANTTPLVTTVTKPATNPRDVDATPRVNIQEFCEEYYEDILPIIMDKVRHDRRKDVHTRLDFEEGHRRQSAFDRLSETYSPRTTKSRPRGTDSRDRPWGRSRPHRLDTSNGDCPKDRERFRSIGESYDDYFSHSYRDENRSRHMKWRRDNESPLYSVSKSDSSDGRYRKSRSKRHKSTDEDDLTRPWMCEEEDPFTPQIRNFETSRRTRMPNNVKTYDETRDPEDHVKIFQAAAQVKRWAMPTWCHMFNSTLIGAAKVWFDELSPESINSYKDLKAAFLAYFMQQKKYVKDPVEIHNIKQKDRETIEDFMERFKVETGRMKRAPECMRISGFMHWVNNPELTKRPNEHVPKTMEEMMITTTAFIRGEAVATNKKKGQTSWKAQDQSKRKTSDKSSDFRGHSREGRGSNRFTPLTRTPKEILAAESGKFQPPPPMVTLVEKKSNNKFCDFHNDKGHITDECMQLKKQIKELVRAGKLSHLIKEIKHGRDQSKTGKNETPAKDKPTTIYMIQSWQRMTKQKVTQSFERVKEITFPPLTASSGTEGPLVIEAEMGGHMIHRMYVDGGSSIEILNEHCFNLLRPEIKNQTVPATTSLTGFSGETIWPLGQLRLLVIIGDADHSTRAWMNFMIVRSLSPYNGIIGRPRIREIQTVPSTAHGMLKFPIEGGIVTIRSTILIPTECTSVITSSAVSKEERTRPDNFEVALHPDFPDQEVAIGETRDIYLKRGQAPERAKDIQEEVQKLVEAGIIREVYYHDWLSNPVMVKKHDGNWRMCVDFTDLNKACPQDCYPLPEIDWKIESLCGYSFKCFLDAYRVYHQIQLAEPNEEKTTFHTRQGVYCYTKMPFGLKNAGVTYQRLMDKAFDSQIGRNIEVYVDDLVVKSYTEAKMLRDIDETFRTLRKINMKLTLKKCTFGVAGGVFLGYVFTPDGTKPCPDKTTAVLQLPSSRTIKEVESLNGKLASLNRFLSKSAEKSLPLFKTLKTCIKKNDFHWTAEAKQAFKQHLSELPLLVAPTPKEELIIYLFATYGAISTVLMTEKEATQTPIYFISRALQGPKLNYTPMEKLVLSLVFATKRLWRTSVKGQILVDFLTEIPNENPQAAPVAETQQDSWTPFTDGSSCVDRSGAGIILTNSEGIKFTYALRFQFAASNNEAEYEALIAGLRITTQMGVQNVHVSVDSKLVANQVLGTYVAKEEKMIKYLDKVKSLVRGFTNFSISQVPRSKNKKADALIKIASTSFAHLSKQVLVEVLKDKSIKEKEVTSVVEEDGPTWMTPIMEYLKKGTLPRIDIAGPFPEGPGKVKCLIVAIDYFAKWIEAKAVATITDGQVKKFVCDNIVCRFGLSGELVSDNGKQFSDNPFKDWCENLNITQRFASVKHPQSNELIERANRSLGEGIKDRLCEGNKNWVEELPHVLWAHRTMIKSSHGDTPFFLTYRTEAVIPAEIGMPTYRTTTVDVVYNDEELRINLDLLEGRRERAAKAKLKMTKYYNARVRSVTFRPGDFVYRSNDAIHAVAGGKLGPKWEGPYEVTEALGDGAYKLRTIDGKILPRTWNIANLKRCYL